MNFDQFTDRTAQAVRDSLGEDCRVSLQKVTKNNGVELTGLILGKEGNRVFSVVYLDSFFREYTEGKPFRQVCRSVLSLCRENPPRDGMSLDFLQDYEKVRKRLGCRLINGERNHWMREEYPCRSLQNLLMVPCCVLPDESPDCASMLISRKLLDLWKIDEDKLFADAMANLPRILPPTLISMEGFMRRELSGEKGEKREQEPVPGRHLYILSNEKHFYGAASLLYPGILRRAEDRLGGPLIILPSSVHEVLLLVNDQETAAADLYEMVRSVNREYVSGEEFLSDDVYYYDTAQDTVRLLPFIQLAEETEL